MQRLTSSVTGDKSDPSGLPGWDRVKNCYLAIKKHLEREPTREDKIPDLYKKTPLLFKELINMTGENRNNANKYFKCACLGPEFMELYEEVNNMHMQCN
jgi:hypothetical protein